jgi:hypothetical protein
VTIKSAGVLDAVKARPGSIGVRFYGGVPAGLDSLCAAPASEICGRGGRKPVARSNKRKRPRKQVSVVAICLGEQESARVVARVGNGRMVPVEQKDETLEQMLSKMWPVLSETITVMKRISFRSILLRPSYSHAQFGQMIPDALCYCWL